MGGICCYSNDASHKLNPLDLKPFLLLALTKKMMSKNASKIVVFSVGLLFIRGSNTLQMAPYIGFSFVSMLSPSPLLDDSIKSIEVKPNESLMVNLQDVDVGRWVLKVGELKKLRDVKIRLRIIH